MARAKAFVGDSIVADSDNTIIVEGNHYFPPTDVNQELLQESDMHTVCHWKGKASYYNVKSGDKYLENAAWYYPEALEEAKNIKGYIAFWQGVIVEEK